MGILRVVVLSYALIRITTLLVLFELVRLATLFRTAAATSSPFPSFLRIFNIFASKSLVVSRGYNFTSFSQYVLTLPVNDLHPDADSYSFSGFKPPKMNLEPATTHSVRNIFLCFNRPVYRTCTEPTGRTIRAENFE